MMMRKPDCRYGLGVYAWLTAPDRLVRSADRLLVRAPAEEQQALRVEFWVFERC
jgi:hypothetical protein